jgi:hypothetical protein
VSHRIHKLNQQRVMQLLLDSRIRGIAELFEPAGAVGGRPPSVVGSECLSL